MANKEMLTRIGKVIRKHREALKMTQEEFANAYEFNPSYFGTLERGMQNLTILNQVRVAAGLGKPLSQIIKEAEKLDLEQAMTEPANPPRRGRPKGKKSSWR